MDAAITMVVTEVTAAMAEVITMGVTATEAMATEVASAAASAVAMAAATMATAEATTDTTTAVDAAAAAVVVATTEEVVLQPLPLLLLPLPLIPEAAATENVNPILLSEITECFEVRGQPVINGDWTILATHQIALTTKLLLAILIVVEKKVWMYEAG